MVQGNKTPTNETEPEAPKRELPEKRILFGVRDSQLFFVSVYRTSVTTDGFSFKTPKDYGVELKRDDMIDGLPQGGCTRIITPELARGWEMGYIELVELIENHSGYGRRFAFLDDKKGSRPILEQMRRQANKEATVNAEAMTEGIARSDMAVY